MARCHIRHTIRAVDVICEKLDGPYRPTGLDADFVMTGAVAAPVLCCPAAEEPRALFGYGITALGALELKKRGHQSIRVRTNMMAAIISTAASRPSRGAKMA